MPRSQIPFGNAPAGATPLRRGEMALRFASKLHPGNGVAGTMALPNSIWEREEKIGSQSPPGREFISRKDAKPQRKEEKRFSTLCLILCAFARDTHPPGMQANSRGLSEATPPVVQIQRLTPEQGVADHRRVLLFCASATPYGVYPFADKSGGIAALNPRLFAVNPCGLSNIRNPCGQDHFAKRYQTSGMLPRRANASKDFTRRRKKGGILYLSSCLRVNPSVNPGNGPRSHTKRPDLAVWPFWCVLPLTWREWWTRGSWSLLSCRRKRRGSEETPPLREVRVL